MSEATLTVSEKYLMIKEVIDYMTKDDGFDTMPSYFFNILEDEEDEEFIENIAHAIMLLFTYYYNMSLDCNKETFMNFWCLYGYAHGIAGGWDSDSLEHSLDWLLQCGAITFDYKTKSLVINDDFLEDLYEWYEVIEYSVKPLLEDEETA